ncbi:MAG: UPF0182 family protein [Gemmatimonadota bacterium]
MKNPGRTLVIGAATLVVVLIVSRIAVGFYTDALWFRQAGYGSVFWTRFTAEVLTRVTAALAGGVLVFANLWIVTRQLGPVHVRRRYGNLEISEQIPRNLVRIGVVVAAALAGWWLSGVKFGGGMSLSVLTWLRKAPWGVEDPLFRHDLSYYVFSLPVLFQIIEFLVLVALWSLVLSTLGYALLGAIRLRGNRLEVDPNPRMHGLLLLAALLVLAGAHLWIGRYSVLLEGSGFNGAIGYTDVHARLPAQRISAILAVLTGAALVFSALRRVWLPTFVAAALLVLAAIGGGALYPSFVQKFRVDPNEFRFEESYIRWNIDFTRRAYGLSDVRRETYDYSRLTSQPPELESRVDEIPVWDLEPLQIAYNQLQTFFPYYIFPNVDYDRYRTDSGLQQVAIGVREFLPSGLAENARTWLNLHFDPKYIRGIGATVTPAAVMARGEPPTWLSNVNPIVRAPDAPPQLRLTEPSIYFGETMDEFIVIRSSTGLAVPSTAIPLSNLLRVIAFSWRFADKNLLFTGRLTEGSHLAFRRRVSERVRTIAPFIAWDPDPYPVVSDGRVVWIVDGYATTNMFPLSRRVDAQSIGSVRYLRNTVKATVDAVSGEVRLYRYAPDDPIVATYANAFPGLFAAADAMPEELRAHVRYPWLYMHEQAEVYGHYHLTNADAFYRGEDVWSTPQTGEAEPGGVPFRAVYQMMTLPGEQSDEFILATPYIARQRKNMTALLVGRNDGEHYGELVMYELPRNQLVPGPAQVQAIVEQDPVISPQLTLWRQSGSDVNIGHARVVPIGNSFLYIMPLILSAQGSPNPELQRSIVSDGNRTAMANTLREALASMFGTTVAAPEQAREPQRARTQAAPQLQWPRRALELLDDAERALRAGDYAGFGQRMNELKQFLQQASSQQ